MALFWMEFLGLDTFDWEFNEEFVFMVFLSSNSILFRRILFKSADKDVNWKDEFDSMPSFVISPII